MEKNGLIKKSSQNKKERKDLLGNDAMPGWTDQSSERREKEKRRDGEMGFGTSAA